MLPFSCNCLALQKILNYCKCYSFKAAIGISMAGGANAII